MNKDNEDILLDFFLYFDYLENEELETLYNYFTKLDSSLNYTQNFNHKLINFIYIRKNHFYLYCSKDKDEEIEKIAKDEYEDIVKIKKIKEII